MSLSKQPAAGPSKRENPLFCAGEEGALFPVGLPSLILEGEAPCDLYQRTRDGAFLFLARKGLPLPKSVRGSLSERGVVQLFVRQEEAHLYFDYLREQVIRIAKDPLTPPEKKAGFIYSSCQDIMARVMTEPRAVFLSQAHEILGPTIDLIATSDEAARHLVQLTAHDHATFVHSTNVGIFATAMARIIYGQGQDLRRLASGFFLHDLGKCRIPLEILNKPGPLTPAERKIINRHPEEGRLLLQQSGWLTEEAEIIVVQHHERDDGTGYPQGLKAREIHPLARICRMADIYEALTADRPYCRKRNTYDALQLMKEELLSDVDQEIFGHFVKLFASD